MFDKNKFDIYDILAIGERYRLIGEMFIRKNNEREFIETSMRAEKKARDIFKIKRKVFKNIKFTIKGKEDKHM